LPNKTILTSTLSLQEAKDSSAIENIITTQDELYKSNFLNKQFVSI
jgi:predicted adenine nucleotide alpha hydrolase (AANH) superfamily ATPase